ncbi:MAG: AI-2E family transporter [Actinobacteria bacterium]|nr:MAG: AI-2E family transporter [Actinomycetota bacterium]
MPVLRRSSDPVRAVLLAGALVAAWLLFRELATLLVLVVITLVIAIPLDACASRLEPRGVPRPAGAAIALIAGLAVLGGVLALVIPPFVDQLQRFVDAVPGILSDLHPRLHHLTGGGPRDAGVRVRDILQGYLDKPLRLLGPIASIGLGVAGVVGTLILVLMTAYYVASRPEPLVDGLLSLFPERRRPEVCETLAELRSAWIGWLQGVGVDMAVSGVLLYVGLRLVGLQYAIVFAALSALLVVVPYLGSIAGAVPPVAVGLADSPGKALVVLGVYVVVQQVEGNVIVPLVMSRTTRIHPAAIVVGVVVVGRVLGFVGLFVAVPLISATLILVRRLWVEPMRRADETPARATRTIAPAEAAPAMEGTPPGETLLR